MNRSMKLQISKLDIKGSDVILGHLRSIASVFVNYAVKANAESEDSLLLPCIGKSNFTGF